LFESINSKAFLKCVSLSLSLSLKETSHPPSKWLRKMGLIPRFNEAARILFSYCIITSSNFFCIINISLLMSVVGNVNGTELVLDLDQAPNFGIKGFVSLENRPLNPKPDNISLPKPRLGAPPQEAFQLASSVARVFDLV